jgi:hypothetical protein
MATKNTDKTRDEQVTPPGRVEAGEGVPDSGRKSVKLDILEKRLKRK